LIFYAEKVTVMGKYQKFSCIIFHNSTQKAKIAKI